MSQLGVGLCRAPRQPTLPTHAPAHPPTHRVQAAAMARQKAVLTSSARCSTTPTERQLPAPTAWAHSVSAAPVKPTSTDMLQVGGGQGVGGWVWGCGAQAGMLQGPGARSRAQRSSPGDVEDADRQHGGRQLQGAQPAHKPDAHCGCQ